MNSQPLNTWQRLLDDEQGTAMTEFVISLPIFLFFFSAIIGLGSVVHAAIDAHTDAAPAFWQEVYSAEDDKSRLSPRTQSWGGNFVENLPFRLYGHWGESSVRTQVNMPTLTGKRLNDSPQGQEITDNVTRNASDIIGDSRAAQGVADDTVGVSLNVTSFGGGLTDGIISNVIGMVTQMLGVNLGVGAGMRYGTVEGGTTTTAEMPYGMPDVHYEVGYSSLVSPNPETGTFIDDLPGNFGGEPESKAWATSWLWVQSEPQYRNLFAIYGNNNNNRLNRNASNDVPVVYDDFGTNPDNPWWCLWCP